MESEINIILKTIKTNLNAKPLFNLRKVCRPLLAE